MTALPVPDKPRLARAALSPCQLHRYHSPAVVLTEYHHRHPVYLQNRLWGRIVDGADLWLCGNCHSAVHEWLAFLLGEARPPDPHPGRMAKAEAERTYDWYVAARATASAG